MGAYIDDGEDVVWVPHAQVEPFKKNKDGSNTFKLVGGPYHDMQMRVYGPFDNIVIKPTEGFIGYPMAELVYEIHPPIRKGGKWVYVYNPQPERNTND